MTFDQYNFEGLNTLVNEEILKSDYSPDAKNVITEGGILKTRNGYSALNGTEISAHPIIGLGGYYSNSDSTKKLVAACNTALYAWNTSTEQFDSIATGLTANDWDFESWSGYLIMANGAEMRKYNGSSVTTLSNAPVGKYVKQHQERLLVGNQTGNKSRISWSELGAPEGWSGDTGDLDVQTNDGDEIKGLHPFEKETLVFKEYSLHFFWGSGPDYYQFMKIGFPGTVSDRTIKTVLAKPYWLARDGVYAFNGSIPYCVSDTIDPYFIKGINQDYIHKAAAIEWKRRYWLAIPFGDSEINNALLIYDPRYDKWFFFENIYASCFVKYKMGNEEYLYFGNSDDSGIVYHGDTGTTDNGTAIDAYWETPWLNLGDPTHNKMIKELRLLVTTYDTEKKLKVSYKKDGSLEYDPLYVSLLNRNGNENPATRIVSGLEIGTGRRVKLKFSGSQFELRGFSLDFEVRSKR